MTTNPNPTATRRAILKAAGAGSLAAALGTLATEDVLARTVEPRAPGDDTVFDVARTVEAAYPQGVASGGPTPTGGILWTRLSPAAYEDDRPVGVQVASDETFEEVVYEGVVPAEAVGPAHDYTVRVDLDGELAAGGRYHYRFVHDGDASPTGRLRTLPDPDTSPGALRLALLTCNDYTDGYFGAYGHVAEEELDFIVHLGDFVYEGGGDGMRSLSLPSGNGNAHTLEDYRHIHRTYRSDENMRAALARHTFTMTWDDHEIVNNRWWNYERDGPGTESHEWGDDPRKLKRLYLRGIAALMEYVPIRVHYDPDADHLHDVFRLYRSIEFGDLATLNFTDERFYRSPPPEQNAVTRAVEENVGGEDTGVPPERTNDDTDRTMLGTPQRDWLVNSLTESETTWNLWAGSVLHAPLKYVNGGETSFYLNYDAWDGYTHERRDIMGDLQRRGVDNLVMFAGDMHASVAAYLLEDYEDLTRQQPLPNDDNRVGVEFMTPAVSSGNLSSETSLPPGTSEEAVEAGMEAQNPHVEWFDWTRWGYTTVDITDDGCIHTAYSVDRSVDDADAPKSVMRSYRVPEGEVELQELASDTAVAPDLYPEVTDD